MLVIGDEILSGRTQDKNVAQVAGWLNDQGIRLPEVRIVPDERDRIGKAVKELLDAYDYVLTTGGIGPTHDDITVDSIAEALGVPVVVHPQARAILEAYYATRGGVNEGRLRMARAPEGAELILNPLSGAPGLRIGRLFILAGVPNIAAAMLESLTGKLEGGRPIQSVTIGAWAQESEVATLLHRAELDHPGVAIGSYPFFRDGKVGANFVIRSEDSGLARSCADQVKGELRAAGHRVIEGGI